MRQVTRAGLLLLAFTLLVAPASAQTTGADGLSAAPPVRLAAAEPGAAPPPAALPALLETPFLAERVTAGTLPPVANRVPKAPAVFSPAAGEALGTPGGLLRTLGGSVKDTRLLFVYGYARLVGYNEALDIEPDLALAFEVEEGRRFTFHLRPGHKWSDGEPFTAEDFRYWWEDMANNPKFSKFGPPAQLLVDGEKPVVEFPDAVTVRYTWSKPNTRFLPALAAAQPIEIFRPAHYLKQFHAKHVDEAALEAKVKKAKARNWVALHTKMDQSYRNANPELPTLQPWVLKTEPPSDRFLFERNPFFHRIDAAGRQLPYIDEVALGIASGDLIPAKVAAGEADLQAAYLSFPNFTFLKRAEAREGFHVRRWLAGKGARFALYPNLNHQDPVWRALFQSRDFRHALSLGINRRDINNAIFYGLAAEGNNTALKRSPLFRDEYLSRFATYDPEEANRLLDGLGLSARDADGIRLLPDGRPLQIIVETAGEEREQTDILELVRDDWARIGVKLFIKASQREIFYNRIKAGSTMMSVWTGLENGVPNPSHDPGELAPLNSDQLQWPAWGLHVESGGESGEAAPLDPVKRLAALASEWGKAGDPGRQAAIWHEMLAIHAEETFTIGIVSGVEQLVVVADRLRNVPEQGIYNYDPGAFFGIYRPDTFFLDPAPPAEVAETRP